MFHKPICAQKFKVKLTYWISKSCLGTPFSMISLCILSGVLLFPQAVHACEPIESITNLNSHTINQVISMTLPSPIYRRWTHSHEEDQGDIRVYRPSDYPLPLARGREGLEFRENGEFIHYQIGPTDRTLAAPGQWTVKETNIVEIQFPNQSGSSYTLTIMECNEQILKVRQTDV